MLGLSLTGVAPVCLGCLDCGIKVVTLSLFTYRRQKMLKDRHQQLDQMGR